MTKRTWITAFILMAVGTCSILISRPAGLGFLLGSLTSVLLYKRNETFWTGILNQQSAHQWTGFPHFVVNYVLIAAVLVLSALCRDYLNIFACAAGLLLIKIAVTIDALLHKEGE